MVTTYRRTGFFFFCITFPSLHKLSMYKTSFALISSLFIPFICAMKEWTNFLNEINIENDESNKKYLNRKCGHQEMRKLSVKMMTEIINKENKRQELIIKPNHFLWNDEQKKTSWYFSMSLFWIATAYWNGTICANSVDLSSCLWIVCFFCASCWCSCAIIYEEVAMRIHGWVNIKNKLVVCKPLKKYLKDGKTHSQWSCSIFFVTITIFISFCGVVVVVAASRFDITVHGTLAQKLLK